jgi:hypothetical protein
LSVDGVELKCDYYYGDRCCLVRSADLSLKTIGTNFTFSGTQEQKQRTTHIWFHWSGRVAHVPRSLFEEFPKLDGLEIWRSDIPILLQSNKIRIIQENAFEHLPNLGRIDLEFNKIKMIAPGTFRNLHQLTAVLLWNNECINDYIGCWDCDSKLNRTELDLRLQPCFENYKTSSNLLNEGENTFFCEIITSQGVGNRG